MSWELASTVEEPEVGSESTLALIVVSPQGITTVQLPPSGRLTIGRAPGNEIAVDDPSMSREHAALHVGATIELEDLGSANGTRIQGAPVTPGSRRSLAIGSAFDLGATIFVLQRTVPSVRRTLETHSYFESRVAEECVQRSRGVRGPFALLRVRVDGRIPRRELELALTKELRPGDAVAAYAPRQFEILLLDTSKSRGEAILREIRARLEQLGAETQVGMAIYPLDGTSADRLICALNEEMPSGASDSVVVDPSMKDLYRIVDRVAQGSISILLLGETGVGKEVVAEAVHRSSPRADAPFLRLNCASLSETLVESDLFGYEKGAFTGADQTKPGLMEVASGGTLFLDEVGELPLQTQAKLLRAIEQREVLRVGGLKPRPIDVRVVAATNRDIEAEIRAGRFRSDLYYRLNGVRLIVPPLRQRKSEIEPLARLFLVRSAEQLGYPAPELTQDSIELLKSYAWPGNIRELRNVMERAALLCTGDRIEPLHLPFEKLSTGWPDLDRPVPAGDRRALILDALEKCAGNQTRAADLLGVSRQTLVKWMTRYDLPRPKKGK